MRHTAMKIASNMDVGSYPDITMTTSSSMCLKVIKAEYFESHCYIVPCK